MEIIAKLAIIALLACLCPLLVMFGAASISGAPNLTFIERNTPVFLIYTGVVSGIGAIVMLIRLVIGAF